jgi:hypothetical protein
MNWRTSNLSHELLPFLNPLGRGGVRVGASEDSGFLSCSTWFQNVVSREENLGFEGEAETHTKPNKSRLYWSENIQRKFESSAAFPVVLYNSIPSTKFNPSRLRHLLRPTGLRRVRYHFSSRSTLRLSTKTVMIVVRNPCAHSFLNLNEFPWKISLSSLYNLSYGSVFSKCISPIILTDILWDTQFGVRYLRNGRVVIFNCVTFIVLIGGKRTTANFHDVTSFIVYNFCTFDRGGGTKRNG